MGLEPMCHDSNPARIHRVWFQDLKELKFLIFHCRKNSVIDKVIDKKWIYLERNTLHRQSVGHLGRRDWSRGWGYHFR